MNSLHKYSVIVFALMSFNINAKNIELDEIKEIALKNNYSVNAARIDTELSSLDEKIVRANYLPQISIDSHVDKENIDSQTSYESSSYLHAQLNLFNGFKDQSELKIKELESSKSISKLKDSKLFLNLKLEKLYYEYLYFAKSLDTVKSALFRNKKHLLLINKRLVSSLVTQTDLLEFELRRSKLVTKKRFLELKKAEKREELFLTAGITDSKQYSLSGELPHFLVDISLEQLLSQVDVSTESIKRLKIGIEQARKLSTKSNSNWFPKIDLEAKYGKLDPDDTESYSAEANSQISLNAKWEIYSGGRTVSEAKKAMLEQRKNEFLLKQRRLDITSIVRTHYQKLLALQSRISSEEKNEKIATKLYANTQSEYQRGIKDSGALSMASDEVITITEQIYQLKKDYISTKLFIESTLGRTIKFTMHKH